MTKERLTSQKQIILDYLKGVKTHPSAEKVYNEVKKKLPRISKGTVYRNLELFSENNEILKIQGEIKRFDGDVSPHHHFICERCDKIFDVFGKIGKINFYNEKIKNIGKPKNFQVYIYGNCKKCDK
jgi:Fe2+ or Zn2+ uptake regulation protein